MNSLSRKMSGAVLVIALLLLCVIAARSFYLAGDPASPSSSAAGSSRGLAGQLAQHLVVLDRNGTLKPFDASGLKDVKYFAFYHSASWCPPCRIFSPKLVKFYNSFRPLHPDFELIFVNHDSSAEDMLAYMKSDAMPWPAVRYDDIDATHLNDMDSDQGLPDLILTDASGKVLSDTFQGSEFVGPDKVVDDIKRLVH